MRKAERNLEFIRGAKEKDQGWDLNRGMRLLTVEQVSGYLHLHPQTIYVMARLGELPILRVGRALRFDKLALDQWIQKKIDENHEKLLQLPDDLC